MVKKQGEILAAVSLLLVAFLLSSCGVMQSTVDGGDADFTSIDASCSQKSDCEKFLIEQKIPSDIVLKTEIRCQESKCQIKAPEMENAMPEDG